MFLFELPYWATGFNFLIGVFGFLIIIAGAFVVLTAKGRQETSTLQVDRANAAEALLKTRDAEIAALLVKVASAEVKLTEIEEELEDVTAEHRAVTSIKIADLMNFWAQKEQFEAEILDLKRQIRVLEKRKDGTV